MKIGITCYPTVGGSGIVATELGLALAEKGHEVHFITSSLPFRLDDSHTNIYYHEVSVSSYAVFQYPPYDLALASKMADVIKEEKLDILHVHYAIPHAVSAFLAKEMVDGNVRIVTTLHGTDITVLGDDPTLSNMIRFSIEKSDIVTAVSDDLIRQTRELLHVKKDIHTVYNFIDERIYHPRATVNTKKELQIKDEQKVLIHISNFRKVKRVDDVVRVFHLVQKEIDSVLLLVGDGPELPIIRQLVKDLGISDRVRILGSQKRVAELLSISDVKLLLSSKESFGLVLLEAMACGVPVVGTDIGGIPEVIEDNVSGFICKLGDIEDIAQKTVELLEDERLHENMAIAARKRATVDFHKQKIVHQYEVLYERALHDKE
ncbi:N-acetyl-alpha-D-glucosaminyl L-malate synthase BshA [Paenalkalicoccus suaedae]|uniref:N-acetyl-alpha-D-glucosaminyl L-malate synthase BshA n=1 Tax=Paenalkalicoccus suaedae TaxID=2592382 RepID=A0A859FE34_9BACI|nr:N-acetyl-alpha-D-glucosaminyl L-malate synthase BshA [Paenalkalicoccus suaedae]QKS71118.1 N-acetyl-alpha-D-glucosaminyl L-malate synthase BshA [Paenalkalicoccus suaedae]